MPLSGERLEAVTLSAGLKFIPENSTRSLLNKQTASSLSKIRDALVGSGALLNDTLHERVAWLINDTLKRLEQNKARIAFIGQVKAGKSSVINALMKRPDFLPTDVNPSTAVITKVYFGSADHPANTALFHFFTEQEWEQLFAAAELSDANEMNFAPVSATRQSLESLRRRAEKRLGPQYAELIGKHHLFSAVTPEIMQSYVSTGDFSNKSAIQGHIFSDVTRMAEIFLDDNPIYYPSVLIDTPGVNDLFFVRDEITRANLADADVYVLVLTAHEPLSRSDISLLRLLRGLGRSRIIAVINRIDTLSDIASRGPNLREQVVHALKRELPFADIPVILVSSLWANAALRESPFAIEGLITPGFIDYALSRGARNLVVSGQGRDPEEVLSCYVEALYSCSGIPDLADSINRMVATSVVEEQLHPGSSTLAAICHNSSVAGHYCMTTLGSKGESSQQPPRKEKVKETALQRLGHLNLLVDNIDGQLRQFRRDWKLFCEAELLNSQRYLQYAVEQFAGAQAFNLFKREKYSSYRLDLFESTLIFRSDLVDMICNNYDALCHLLFDKQREGEGSIRTYTLKLVPDLDNILHFGMISTRPNPIYLMPLAKATIFEMDDFWQQEMMNSTKPYEKKVRDLELIMMSEFDPMIKEIMQAAAAGLELTIDEIIRNLTIFIFSTIYPIVQFANEVENLCNSECAYDELARSLNELADRTGKAIELFEQQQDSIAQLKKTMFTI
jgi:ethanolamine utilization protein EutP (predicted NTPase)